MAPQSGGAAMKLTNTKVKSLPIPTDKDQVFYWDSETRGFGLRVNKSGAKSWIVQGRTHPDESVIPQLAGAAELGA